MLNLSRKLLQCHGNRWRHAGPLWMGAPLVHSSSLLDWLAGKLHGAAMATDWSYAERGCRLQRHHGAALSVCRKLDWLWWGLDLGQMANIGLWGIWKKMEIDVLTSVSVCACVCTFFLVGPTKPREWWCNMPAIHQTRLSTCGLTLSLQLLKYVVSNYWNMYATSVPRNTFSLAFSHPASQPRVLQHQQI